MQGILGLLFSIVSLIDPHSYMSQQELISFMEAIKQQENAGGNYTLKHKPTTILDFYGNPLEVQALGAYGILDVNWDVWAAEAGYKGADWQIPEMQDIVAAYKMTEYFNKYGTWDMVAVAWYGGPGKANIAAAEGIDSVGDIGNLEGFGPNIRDYVNSVMETYAENLEREPENEDVSSYIQQQEQVVTSKPKLNVQDGGMVPTVDPMQKFAVDLLSALVPKRNMQSDFESQVPEEAGSFEGAQIKTEIVRDENDEFTIEDIMGVIEG